MELAREGGCERLGSDSYSSCIRDIDETALKGVK